MPLYNVDISNHTTGNRTMVSTTADTPEEAGTIGLRVAAQNHGNSPKGDYKINKVEEI